MFPFSDSCQYLSDLLRCQGCEKSFELQQYLLPIVSINENNYRLYNPSSNAAANIEPCDEYRRSESKFLSSSLTTKPVFPSALWSFRYLYDHSGCRRAFLPAKPATNVTRRWKTPHKLLQDPWPKYSPVFPTVECYRPELNWLWRLKRLMVVI